MTLGDIVSNTINMMIMKKSTSLDLYHFEHPEFYDMLTRAQREATYKPLVIISTIFDLVRNGIAIFSLIGILFLFHWMAVVFLILANIPYAIIKQKYSRKEYDIFYSQTQDSRKLFYLKNILISNSFFKEIRLFNLGQYLIEKYKETFKNIFQEKKHMNFTKNINLFFVSLLSLISYISVYFYIIYRTIIRSISLGDMTLYSSAFSQCQDQFINLLVDISTLYQNSLFINNLFEFLNLKPKIASPEYPMKISDNIQEGITFKNVSFKYPGSKKFIFTNLNLRIRPSENIAIVGDNGAGKTTLIKLLCRFYDPDSGEILLDGINIKNFDVKSYQEKISVIFQDYAKFNLTARENIGIGYINEIENTTRIQTAAKKSGADQVIKKLPHGYNSMLGRIFDEGCQISIGEWQKIAIARALMNDSKILILDEPTASLDPKTEYEIFKRFKDLTKNKISILISHRFSTVCMADRIIVLEDGRIIEEGSHKELMRRRGKYAKLFLMQAEKYFNTDTGNHKKDDINTLAIDGTNESIR
jgi:ATP-binding cassette subfamily B protein